MECRAYTLIDLTLRAEQYQLTGEVGSADVRSPEAIGVILLRGHPPRGGFRGRFQSQIDVAPSTTDKPV